MKNIIENSHKGWECPKCGKINAPHINQCSCVKTNVSENKEYNYSPTSTDGRQILSEVY